MKKNIAGCIVSSVVAFFVGVIGTYLVVVNFNPTTENVIKNIKSVEVVDNSIAIDNSIIVLRKGKKKYYLGILK